MKKLVFMVLLCTLTVSTASAAWGFPSFPMSIWGTLKDGSTNIAAWVVVRFLDSNNTILTQYTTTRDGQFGWVSAVEIIPTLQAFAWNLSIQVVYQGNTITMDTSNMDDTNKGINCPTKSAIAFISEVCRYDLNIAKKIGTFGGTINNTGSVIFSGATTSWIQLNSSGTLILMSLSGASKVSLPTNLTISSSGNWDGYFKAPEQTSAIWTITLTGYTRANALTYKIGSDVASLTLSGASASITIVVGSEYNGKTMKIYRSEDNQQTYMYLADCLVSNSECIFATNKFSIFSIIEPTDTTPDDFSFSSLASQELNSPISSNVVTISGINTLTSVAVTNGLFQINSSGSWLTDGTVNSGDTITAKVTSSSSYSSITSVNIVVGTVTKTFSVTTKVTPVSWGGGWGGSVAAPAIVDSCPNGDFSSSKTDGVCAWLAQITTSGVQKITANWALLGGSITSSGWLMITERGIVYSTWLDPIINSGATIKVPNRSDKWAYIFNATSLIPNTKYYVKAYAINSRWIAYGNEVSFSTTNASDVSIIDSKIVHKNIPKKSIVQGSPKTISDLKFVDIQNSWAYDYIVKLSLGWIINNGEKFNPENNTTRAEFMKMIVLAGGADVSNTSKTTPFGDVDESSWFAPYVAYAVENNLINSTLKTFRPNDTITREEVMKILALSLKLDTGKFTKTSFTDMTNDSWFVKYIEAVREQKIISGQTIGGKLVFRPKDKITRAEIAKILAR